MKIDLVLHSCDSNPFYLDFWPSVSRIWKEVFGLTPVLIYIDDNHDLPVDDTYGIVVKIKPVPEVPLYLQTQWARFWFSSQHPDKVCLVSDIDMYPVSKRYFIEQIKDVPDTKYVHLNPREPVLNVCYHVAKGSLFKKVLCLEETWEESIRNLYDLKLGRDWSDSFNPHLKGKIYWGAEEAYTTRRIREYSDPSVFVLIPRTHGRIDRIYWHYSDEGLRNDAYADCHSIRPYSDPKNKVRIDELIEKIYKYA